MVLSKRKDLCGWQTGGQHCMKLVQTSNQSGRVLPYLGRGVGNEGSFGLAIYALKTLPPDLVISPYNLLPWQNSNAVCDNNMVSIAQKNLTMISCRLNNLSFSMYKNIFVYHMYSKKNGYGRYDHFDSYHISPKV